MKFNIKRLIVFDTVALVLLLVALGVASCLPLTASFGSGVFDLDRPCADIVLIIRSIVLFAFVLVLVINILWALGIKKGKALPKTAIISCISAFLVFGVVCSVVVESNFHYERKSCNNYSTYYEGDESGVVPTGDEKQNYPYYDTLLGFKNIDDMLPQFGHEKYTLFGTEYRYYTEGDCYFSDEYFETDRADLEEYCRDDITYFKTKNNHLFNVFARQLGSAVAGLTCTTGESDGVNYSIYKEEDLLYFCAKGDNELFVLYIENPKRYNLSEDMIIRDAVGIYNAIKK